MMHRISIAVVAAAVAFPTFASANLLINGSFETGDLTGWILDPQGLGHTTANVYSGIYCCQGATPPDGTFAVAFGGGGPGSGEIAQAFATVAGNTYTGSVEYAGVGVADSVVVVTLADAIAQTAIGSPATLTPSFDGNWHTYNFSFVATSALSAIDIYGPSDGGCCSDTNVDNVIVTPEPASLGLLAFGGVGLVARRRRA